VSYGRASSEDLGDLNSLNIKVGARVLRNTCLALPGTNLDLFDNPNDEGSFHYQGILDTATLSEFLNRSW
jgi:hypothetical protein